MNSFFDFVHYTVNGVLSGVSLVMAYWLLICTMMTALMCWKHRDRLWLWHIISAEEKADASLNWGLAMFFGYAFIQRASATYSYAVGEWRLGAPSQILIPYYMPLSLAGLALILWWMAFHHFGRRRRWYWCLWMCSGLAMFSLVVLIVEI